MELILLTLGLYIAICVTCLAALACYIGLAFTKHIPEPQPESVDSFLKYKAP